MAVKTKDYVVNVIDTQNDYNFSAKKKTAIYLKGINQDDIDKTSFKIENDNLVFSTISGKIFTVSDYTTIQYIKTNALDNKTVLLDLISNNYIDNTKNEINTLVKPYYNSKKLTITGTNYNDKIDLSNTDYEPTGKTNIKNNKGLTINGGNGNDEITGTDYNDIIKGGNGNDDIYGSIGNDKLYGNGGNNKFYFYSGDGTDTIYSDKIANDKLIFEDISFEDILYSVSGNHLIISGYGSSDDKVILDNYFRGNSSIKKIVANDGEYDLPSVILGTNKANTLNGTNNTDYIYGYNGNDTINAYDGNDVIDGGNGNDIITAGKGNDTIQGGAGNDSYYFSQGDGLDTIISTKGTDTLYFTDVNESDIELSQIGNDLIIDYSNDDTVGVSKVLLKDFCLGKSSVKYLSCADSTKALLIKDMIDKEFGKHVIGTNENDVIYGSKGDDIIHGKLGADKIYGYAGNDILESFIDAYIDAGDGDDYVDVEHGFSTIYGGKGNDVLSAGGSHNTMEGGDGDDVITSGYASYIHGGNGNDHININSRMPETSYIYGGYGDDVINTNAYYSYIYAGNDNEGKNSGNDTLKLGGYSNYIYMGDDNNTLTTMNGYYDGLQNGYNMGHNQIYFGDGNNTLSLYYGSNDYIELGDGNNNITLTHGTSDNIINCGNGNNVINSEYSTSGYSDHSSNNNVITLGNGKNTVKFNAYAFSKNDVITTGDGTDIFNVDYYAIIDNTTFNGGAGNDIYNIEFQQYTYVSNKHKNIIISDSEGNDSIIFKDSVNEKTNFNTYINVYQDKTYDNDLIIYDNFDERITIKEYMTTGRIETIKTYDNYTINQLSLNSIIQNVATWLSGKSSYTCVQDVIDSGNTTDISTVIAKFNNNIWTK